MIALTTFSAGNAVGAPETALQFSAQEKAYIEQTRSIKMCVDPDWAPFERINGQGQHEGIAADLVQLVAGRVGLRIELHPVKDWNESLSASKNKICQIMSFLNQSPERDAWLIFTSPIFSDPNVIITREEHRFVADARALQGERIALPHGTMVEERVRRDFPDLKIILAASEPEAMVLVSERKADLTIRSLIIAANAIKKEGLFNLKIAGQIPEYTNQLRIGVLKEEPLLRAILDKGVRSITPQEREAISNKHVSISVQQGIDWTRIYILLALLAATVLVALHIHRNNRRLKIALEASQAARTALRIAATAFESQDGMMVTDANTVILRVNGAFSRITGYAQEEVIGQTPRILSSGRHAAQFYTEMWESIQRTGAWHGEIWNRRKNGEIYPQQLTVTSVTGEHGQLTHYVATMHDITQRKRLEEEVQQLAFFDPLTRLPNRRLFNDRLSQIVAQSRRTQTRTALMFIDLDKFKPINDQQGHDTGDWVLQTIARRIERCLRTTDTVARVGGDEFLVILPAIHSANDALVVAEKIRAELECPFVTESQLALHLSASIGIALCPDHADTEGELLRFGDQAMYLAKKSGGNCVELWSPALAAVAPDDAPHPHDALVLMKWKPSFSCGQASIDHEHRELFRLGNVLLATLARRGDDPDAFETAADELMTHIVEHFAHEEAILETLAYEHLTEHAAIHEALVAQALRLRHADPQKGQTSVGQWVDFLVTEVVGRHMLTEDRKFASLFSGTEPNR